MIGKYERGEAVPSIDAAKKIADALEASLDYLVGEGALATLDKKLLKRIEDIGHLDEETQKHPFFLMDNVIQNYKTKKAFGK